MSYYAKDVRAFQRIPGNSTRTKMKTFLDNPRKYYGTYSMIAWLVQRWPPKPWPTWANFGVCGLVDNLATVEWFLFYSAVFFLQRD